jgi:uncharacterized protein (DUF2252 family)
MQSMKSAQAIILNYNQNLAADRQAEKYKAIQESLLRFYRGTCHLFYDRLNAIGTPKDKTKAWICGDLHLENFGSFKGDNRLVYFDVNDFDESILAPLSWEVVRLITAILVSRDFLKYSEKEASSIAKSALQNYTAAIIRAKALIMQREAATGLMKSFFDQVADRKRQDFISEVTDGMGKKRVMRIDNNRSRKLDKDLYKKLMTWLPTGLGSIEKLKDLKVEDCAFRLAGTGGLGMDRYVILTKERSTGKYYLLDMKEAKTSALLAHLKVKQPKWKNEAERIVTTQNRMQFYSPALLSPVHFDNKYFVVKELQPVQDKMDFKLCADKFDHMRDVILSMTDIAAYTHLRGTGRQGSSTADELAELVSRPKWQKEVYDLSQELAKQTVKDYNEFLGYSIPKRG